MKINVSHSRKSRFARISLVLAVLVITVTVLCNVMVATLCNRYSLFTPMLGDYRFEVSETAYAILDDAFARENADGSLSKVRILFCDSERALREDAYTEYMLTTAQDLAARYPERIAVEFHDILVNPDAVRPYQTEIDPVNGEEIYYALDQASVVLVCGENFLTHSIYDFFSYMDDDVETVWAYKGERMFVASVLRVLQDERPSVVFTSNHGESFYDAEILMLLEEAGYFFRYMDLYKEDIPSDCDLIICFNPNADFTVDDGIASVSEIEKLESFLSQGGKSFLLAIDSATPNLPNLEGFLAEWGIAGRYHKDALTGLPTRYAVRDEGNSLTSDGYTVFGELSTGAVNGGFLPETLGVGAVFKDATSLRAAAGYEPTGNHVYTKGDRTVYGLFAGRESANSWANGIPVDEETSMLMAVTEETVEGRESSFVGVCASTQFMAEEYLQTAVYGNPSTLFYLFERLGAKYTPAGLQIQPFRSTEISSITTAQMWRWMLSLALIPAALVTGVALWRLVRRRRA